MNLRAALAKVKLLLFHNIGVRQTVAKNTFWLAVSNVGGRLLRAFVIIYAARVLGAAQWGVFSYAVTLAAFLTIFVDFGINAVFIREAAKTAGSETQDRVLATSFFLKTVLLAAGVMVILFVAPAVTTLPGVVAILPLVALIFVFDTFRQFGFSLIQALERMEREAALFLFTNLAIVGFGFAFLSYSRTVSAFATAYAIGTGLGMTATLLALRKRFRGIMRNFDSALVKPILRASWPFAASALLGVLMLNTDILIMGWLRTAEDVGVYSAANRIIQLLYILPTIVAASTLPVFSRLAREGATHLRPALERVVSGALLVALPAAIGGFLVGREIMAGVFGQSYGAGGWAFRILMLTMIVDFPAVILNNVLFAHDRQKKMIAYAAIGGFTNVAFDLLLIPPYGMVGSALATLGAQCVSNVYLWRTVRRAVPFGVLSRLRTVILATATMSVLTLILAGIGVHFLAIIAAAALCYASVLILAREPLLREMWDIVRSRERAAPLADPI